MAEKEAAKASEYMGVESMRSWWCFSLLVACLLLCGAFVGCHSGASIGEALDDDREQTMPGDARPVGYYLMPGDVFEVKFFHNPELNETVIIRPDGRISLQLVGEMAVTGLTPAECQAAIAEKYQPILRRPEVTVVVREYSEPMVYVGGEVLFPKEVPYVNANMALWAIFQAGGFRDTACVANVIIISKSPDGGPVVRMVNLTSIDAHHEDESSINDIALRPFDIVYVPKTKIAKANVFVEQHFTRMVPGFLSANYSYANVRTTW